MNGELSPGSTKPRWEPEQGFKKWREKIHKESKFADDHKDLPYKFFVPRRYCRVAVRCTECGYTFTGSRNTVMVICPECKELTKAELVDE